MRIAKLVPIFRARGDGKHGSGEVAVYLRDDVDLSDYETRRRVLGAVVTHLQDEGWNRLRYLHLVGVEQVPDDESLYDTVDAFDYGDEDYTTGED